MDSLWNIQIILRQNENVGILPFSADPNIKIRCAVAFDPICINECSVVLTGLADITDQAQLFVHIAFADHFSKMKSFRSSLALLVPVFGKQNAAGNADLIHFTYKGFSFLIDFRGNHHTPDISSGNGHIVRNPLRHAPFRNINPLLIVVALCGKHDRRMADFKRNTTSGNINKIIDQFQTVFLIVIIGNCLCKRLIGIINRMGQEIQESLFIKQIRLKPDDMRRFF